MKRFKLIASLLLLSILYHGVQAQDVGVLDIRNRTERFVTLTTASVSEGRVVVLFRGTSQEYFDIVRKASQRAVDDGFEHLAGIVRADPDAQALQGKDCVQIYFDGVPVTGLLDASDPYALHIIQKGIWEAYKRCHHLDKDQH